MTSIPYSPRWVVLRKISESHKQNSVYHLPTSTHLVILASLYLPNIRESLSLTGFDMEPFWGQSLDYAVLRPLP